MDKIKRALRAARPKYQDGGSLPFVSIPADDLAKAQADPHRYERFFQPVATAVKSLGDLVKAPFDMARDARQAGGYSQLDPTDVGRAGLNTGLGTLMPAVGGVGGRGGAVLMSGAGPVEKKGITAYHGSPHDFDRFDMSKIGTGEGAQAYGHGLYFAQSEDVARSYRDGLSKWNPQIDGQPVIDLWANGQLHHKIKDMTGLQLPDAQSAGNWVAEAVRSGRPLRQVLDDKIATARSIYPADLAEPEVARINAIGQKIEPLAPETHKGRMYEVRIDADPEDFLDWDKPLSQQSPKIQKALAHVDNRSYYDSEFNEEFGNVLAGTPYESMSGRHILEPILSSGKDSKDFVELVRRSYPDAAQRLEEAIAKYGKGVTGSQAYKTLAHSNRTFEDFASQYDLGDVASQQLLEAGIPGIKYLDAGSRGYQVHTTYKGQPYREPMTFKDQGSAEAYAAEQRAMGFGADIKQDGSRNYVLFRDDIVNIVRKYGMAAAVSMYGADAVNNALQPMATGNDG